jgi:uncharacterized membrane protein
MWEGIFDVAPRGVPSCQTAAVDEVVATAADAVDGDVAEADDVPASTPSPWWHRITPPTAPQVLLAGALIAWTWYFTARTLDVHHALGTSTYDSALYDQGMWLLSRFDAPFVTLMGRNLFGDHTSFILVPLVPLYWIAPGAWIMFTAQSAAIAAGAIPVFLAGRKLLGSEWAGLIGAATYLLHPAVSWTNLENFHPDAFLGVTVGFAIYFAIERRWRLYAVAVVLALLVKEDVALVVMPLGIWVALRRDRRIGVITALGSLAFALMAMFLVKRSLIGVPTRNLWRIPFGGPTGFLRTVFTDPGAVLDHFRADGRPWYLVQMTAPFAWLFLRMPDVALISGLVLFTNVLSTFAYQYDIQYHYSLIAVPALAIGTLWAIAAIRDRAWTIGGTSLSVQARGVALAVLVAASVTGALLWSPSPIGGVPSWRGDPTRPDAVAARELFELIPDDAAVAAHYRITPQLAHRPEIYQFPVPFRVVLYGPDTSMEGTRLDERSEGIDYVMLPVDPGDLTRDWLAVADAFDEIGRNEYWVLYQRDRSELLPSP